ncbi:Gfo/Idh/MocA family protein [Bacillus sp. DJP31]|uniref:Gfo/Idh/MocA family protein n=1 Tax=Bacillus sp. DJP31 TaxID=3409789 RepID=UPI003BB785E7
MQEKKIRVGIIGTGFGAKVHAPIMQNHPGFEVVAISGVHRGNLEVVKEETGVAAVYDNWRDMLRNETLDLLSVASAPYLHFDMVMEGLKQGLHILCEKPMAFDAKQSKEMLSVKNELGLYGFINFEFRFLPARQKVKEILSSGSLGEILHIHYKCTYNSYLSLISNKRGWLGLEQYGGGMLGAIGSHMFDSLLWWVGDDLKEVYGQLPIHVPSITKDLETEIRTAEDSFQTVGTFKQGTSFTAELISASLHKANQWRVEVFGTNGTLVMTDDKQVQLAIGGEELTEIDLSPEIEEPKDLSTRTLAYYQAFYPMLDKVYETVNSSKVSDQVPTFESGHRVQLILDAIRLSAKEGRKVEL